MPRHTNSRERLLEVASDLIWRQSYYGTSVDLICEKCGIRKGSFYHHFPSKEELVIAAMEANWQGFRQFMNEAFSASRPALERFRHFIRGTVEAQERHHKESGVVLGCPLYSLGTEIGTQEPRLRALIDEHLAIMVRFYASAIRDGTATGEIPACDPEVSARQLLTFMEGSLTLGRIQNDLRPIRDMEAGVLRLLGVGTATLAA